jgi:hypothetical protein
MPFFRLIGNVLMAFCSFSVNPDPPILPQQAKTKQFFSCAGPDFYRGFCMPPIAPGRLTNLSSHPV